MGFDTIPNAMPNAAGKPEVSTIPYHTPCMKRLAYLTSQYPATSHTFIRREVQKLRDVGLNVDTFSIRRPSEGELEADVDRRESEATWYVLPPKPAQLLRAHAKALFMRPGRYLGTLRQALLHRVPGTKAALWSIFHFGEAIALAHELERRNIGHLHNHFANSGANVGVLASRFLGIDWSLTLHGISEFDYPAGLLLAEKIAAAKFVACVSHFARAQAMRLVDVGFWDKLVVVRCGLDLERFRAAKSTSVIPPNKRACRLVSVGRLSSEKGQAGLLCALAKVARERDVELRLVGDGPERKELEALTTRLGLDERVTFVGRVPSGHVAAELLQADAFIMSSFMEGLPVVLIEALAMSVPVIAPFVAGIPELVEHGVSGLLFPASDWNALAAMIERLIGDPQASERMAEEGRRRVEAEFELSTAVAPLIRLFREEEARPESALEHGQV